MVLEMKENLSIFHEVVTLWHRLVLSAIFHGPFFLRKRHCQQVTALHRLGQKRRKNTVTIDREKSRIPHVPSQQVFTEPPPRAHTAK